MDETQKQAAVSLTPALSPPPASQESRRGKDGAREGVAGKAKKPALRRMPVIFVGTLLLGALFYWGFGYLAESLTHESTDDAFIDANIVMIAPRVGGQVTSVFVARNQAVKKGEPLADIDPRDLEVALSQKQAAVNAARANVELLKAQVDLSRTQVASAEATAKEDAAQANAAQASWERANLDLRRASELITNRTISPQEFDMARTTAAAAEASWKAGQGKAASSQAKVEEAQAQVTASQRAFERGEAQVKQADADVEAAKLNLSYAHIVAPEDGRVTRKAVEAGNYVQVGQSLMALVPQKVFVTANFKETQLVNIRTNQRVKIDIDSVKGGPFAGYVESIQAGSGAAFSLLPPENAVGNYVKVVQRIPVKILFDKPVEAGHVLGPGMSVIPWVHVTDYEVSETVVVAAAAGLALVIGVLWWMLARRRGAAESQ